MNNFDDETWVAYSDLSGLKAMYKNDPEDAAKALDKFYNKLYDVTDQNQEICSIAISDCAVIWINQNECQTGLHLLLECLKSLHQKLLPQYLLRSTVAYGHFRYENRLAMPRIDKNLIIGSAYMEAYIKNDRIPHGAIEIVKLPEDRRLKDLLDKKQYVTRQGVAKGQYEYLWAVNAEKSAKCFINERKKIEGEVFVKLRNLYQRFSNDGQHPRNTNHQRTG